MKYIIDTSYWIEFFKRRNPYFNEVKGLLEDQKVIALSFVFGELLQGCKSNKEKKIISEYWESLPKQDESLIWIEAGIYSNKHNLINKGIGLIDSAIIVSSINSKSKILSLDKKILKHIEN